MPEELNDTQQEPPRTEPAEPETGPLDPDWYERLYGTHVEK